MSADTSNGFAHGAVSPGARRHFLFITLLVAALANALVPAVFFSETHLFGHTEPAYRALIAAVVVIDYAIAFLLLLLHANVGFASGYAFATAAVVALSSVSLAFITLDPAGWGWNTLYVEVLVVGGLAFAVCSNFAFLIASIRYARAIHPRLHLGGFFFGIATSLIIVVLYAFILSSVGEVLINRLVGYLSR